MIRLAIPLAVVAAAVAGFLVRGGLPTWSPALTIDVEHEDEHEDEHEHEEEEPHVPLTEEAFKTLGLRLGPVQIGDYRQMSRAPAEVVELPGVSAYKLAAPVNGVVVSVAAPQGASIAPGQRLFAIRLTDERVLDAQLQLVEGITRREIVDAELNRLAPLAASGAVRGRQRLELEYERRELQATIALRRDELLVRGLTEQQIDALIETRRLLRTVVVGVPAHATEGAPEPPAASPMMAIRPVAWEQSERAPEFIIEELLVMPGETVRRGQSLCDLACHERLYLCGQAFERDLPLLALLAQRGDRLSAEFGHGLSEHGLSSSLVGDLVVRYVANHVDPDSTAYPFYLPLRNELLYETTDGAGFRYRTWRFSVGQRAHVLLPTRRIEGQIPLPIEAVAIDGPNAVVFGPHEHADDPSQEADVAEATLAGDDEHEEAFIELEPIPVQVLHRDNRRAVIATGGRLKAGDTIAMNSAYQLLLALKSDAQGGGHHHHHDH